MIMPRKKQLDEVTVRYVAEKFIEGFKAFGTSMFFRDADAELSRRLLKLDGAKEVQREWFEELIQMWYEEPPFPEIKF